MKIGKYLKFHFDSLEKEGLMPTNGICNNFENDILLNLFIPTDENVDELESKGFSIYYWACGVKYSSGFLRARKYTPLRQTIVLFLAAMNGEL